VLEDDDEVAVAHSDQEHGFAPLTEAMVNVRDFARSALAEKLIGSETAARVLEAAKALFYPERTYARMKAEAARLGADPAELERFDVHCKKSGPSLKTRDAIELLEFVRDRAETLSVPEDKRPKVERTVFLGDLLRSLEPPPLPARDPLFARLVMEEAARRGVEATVEEVQAESEAFRRALGLDSAKATERWLSAHGISLTDLRDWMIERVLAAKLR
jgi:hypothetical protein